ncbi:MAG: histone deacetylase [Gemmatimonadota bacterium]
MPRIGLYTHESCSLHDTGWGHPEHQGRLRAVMQAVEAALPELAEAVQPVQGRPIAPAVLATVHDGDYLERVRATVERARREDAVLRLDPDTVVSAASWDAALAAAGCVVDAVQAVCAGRLTAAFCAVRPPGHHATRDRAMGFCVVNSAAVAARDAIVRGLATRVLIVDWDVHHGNGTQEIFYEDPSVYYLSMHQHPFYPGTGMEEERGGGEGWGTTLNLPLPPGLPPERYVGALLEAVDEAAGSFAPDLVLVSAGFDAAADDPLGGFTLEASHFRHLTLEVVRRTRRTTGGRIVSLLEGGYNPPELGRNVVAHLRGLAEAAGDDQSERKRGEGQTRRGFSERGGA